MGYFPTVGTNRAVISGARTSRNTKDNIICGIGKFCQGKTLYTLTCGDKYEIKLMMNKLNQQTSYFFYTTDTESIIYCGILLYTHFTTNIPDELQEVRDFLFEQFDMATTISSNDGSSWRDSSDKYFQQLIRYLHNPIPDNNLRSYFGGRQEHDFPRIVTSFGEIPTRFGIAQINCVVLDYKFLRLREVLFLSNSSFTDCTQVQLGEYFTFLKTHKADLELCYVEQTNLATAFNEFKNVLENVNNYLMTKYEFYVFELICILIRHYEYNHSDIISNLIQLSANEINMNYIIAEPIFDAMLEGCSDNNKSALVEMLFQRFTIDLRNTIISI